MITLPVHPRTGLTAIALIGGRAVWPIMGGSEPPNQPPPADPAPTDPPAQPPAPPAADPPATGSTDPADPPLGPAGEKALAEMKKRARDAEALVKQLQPKVSEYEKWQDKQKTDLERAQETATKAEARVKAANQRAVRGEVKALAAEGFADPDDAVLNLGDLDQFVTGDGETDTKAITARLAEVLKAKPHLARTAGGPRTPAPDPSQGARAGGAPDVDSQIKAAEAKGDWKTVLKLQNSKLANLKPQ